MLDLFPSRTAGRFGRRLKHARGGRIPVTVVTGFLGAGKTALVKQFLGTPQGRGTAVIVNEYGAVGIDDFLVREVAEQTTLLGNGCVCCVTRTDLQIALRQLMIERERGQVPHFVRVVIETSGLADPAPILQTFSTDRALGGEFFIEVVVAVVDAATGLATLEWSPEARKQVILADRIAVTKRDLVAADAIATLTARLRSLNPHAAIEIAVAGGVDARFLTENDVEAESFRTGFIAEANHGDGILSFVLCESKPLEWDAFARSMEILIAMRGPDLLRVKGFANVAGCHGPVLVQFVQHLSQPPVELAAWPNDRRDTQLVFITRNIAEQDVRALLGAVQALAARG